MATLIPVDVVEALMGHEGYLTDVYRRYTEKDLASFYKQGEPSLRIFSRGEEIAELRKEVKDRNEQLQELVNGLTSKNFELDNSVTELRKNLSAIRHERNVLTEKLSAMESKFNVTADDIVAEANSEYSGVGGGISGRQIWSIEDLSEEEIDRFFQRALRHRMLEDQSWVKMSR